MLNRKGRHPQSDSDGATIRPEARWNRGCLRVAPSSAIQRHPLRMRQCIPHDRPGYLHILVLGAIMAEPIVNTAADPVDDPKSYRPPEQDSDRHPVRCHFLLAWMGLPFEIPYIGCGLASAFVFQIAVRPYRWEIFGVVARAGLSPLSINLSCITLPDAEIAQSSCSRAEPP